MTKLAWLCCAFGVLVIIAIAGVLAWDPYAVATGSLTVSAFTLRTAISSRLFTILIVAIVILPASILCGHLMWATDGTGRPFLAMAAMLAFASLGFLLGHYCFGQS